MSEQRSDLMELHFDENCKIASFQLPESLSSLVRNNEITIDSFKKFCASFDYFYCHSTTSGCCKTADSTDVCFEKYFNDFTLSIKGVLEYNATTKHSTLKASVSTVSNSVLQLNQLIEIIINEIRNPVAGLIATSNLYLDYGSEFKLDKEEYFKLSKEYAIKLSSFVDQVLCLLRIEAKAISKQESVVHVKSIIQDCIALEKEKLDKLNLRVKVDLPEELFIAGNEELVRVAISNLLQNSLQFGEPDRDILISTTLEDTFVGINFVDHGFGIEPSNATKIFDSFYRVKDSTVKNHPYGLGLGLSLVKSIVNHQNGKLKLCSQPTIGSQFTILLPQSELVAI